MEVVEEHDTPALCVDPEPWTTIRSVYGLRTTVGHWERCLASLLNVRQIPKEGQQPIPSMRELGHDIGLVKIVLGIEVIPVGKVLLPHIIANNLKLLPPI